eukprot:1292914-Prymnesium_polylepis.1
MEVIRGEYKVDGLADEDYVQNVELWISHIAYKLTASGRKGWHVAEVTAVTTGDDDEPYCSTAWGDLEINAKIYSFQRQDNFTCRPPDGQFCHQRTPLGEDVAEAAAQGAIRAPRREKKKGP